MIIVDYMSIAMSVLFTQMQNEKIEEKLLKHMILNTIRAYNVKFRNDYGKLVLACDERSWRKDAYNQYKANRTKSRTEDDTDWDMFFNIINELKSEIDENFPWKVVSVYGAEADDVIAALVFNSQEFGQHEDIMIVSSDKDFIQLHVHKNVKQFSPATKKMVKDKNPSNYLIEHIFSGDSGDGVPNVRSGDNTFVDGLRQNRLTTKTKKLWLENLDNLESVMTQDEYRNYQRNKKVIDLREIPSDLNDKIIETYDNASTKNKLFNYLIKSKLTKLIGSISDF